MTPLKLRRKIRMGFFFRQIDLFSLESPEGNASNVTPSRLPLLLAILAIARYTRKHVLLERPDNGDFPWCNARRVTKPLLRNVERVTSVAASDNIHSVFTET